MSCQWSERELRLWLNGHGVNGLVDEDKGHTPLHVASQHGYQDVVRYLLSAGANTRVKDKQSREPLQLALHAGHGQIVDMILSHQERWIQEYTPEAEHIYFAEQSPSRQAPVEPSTSFREACLAGDVGQLQELLQSTRDSISLQAMALELYRACFNGYTAIVDLLLYHGARLTHKDDKGWTALHVASSGGHTDILKYLLPYTEDVDEKETQGATALMLATQHQQAGAAHILLKAGADVNSKDQQGNTALHVACRRKCKDIAWMLLGVGADPKLPNNNHESALATMKRNGWQYLEGTQAMGTTVPSDKHKATSNSGWLHTSGRSRGREKQLVSANIPLRTFPTGRGSSSLVVKMQARSVVLHSNATTMSNVSELPPRESTPSSSTVHCSPRTWTAKRAKQPALQCTVPESKTWMQGQEVAKDTALIPKKLKERIERLEQLLKIKSDSVMEQRAEVALNLGIPPSRFSEIRKARDQYNRVIKGAHGALYTARLGGHRVALKQIEDVHTRPRLSQILTASDTSGDDEVNRLNREALILLSVRHPNIVSFLGLSHDEANSTLSFVLSWAEGGSLYDHMHVHGRTLASVQRARVAMEVAGAMQFLHAHDIVHRDLKSPNVLLDGTLSAKVADFGLSAFKRGDDKTLTHQKGTPLWASPEQLLELKLYADTDVFSFGVLYWELCFNCKPWHHGKYQGKGASVIVIAKAYEKHSYLPVDEEINGTVLSPAQRQLLNGCFDVQGNRLDFSQLHMALRELHKAATQHQELDEQQQTEMLFGPKDAVWKFPPSLLAAVKAVTKQLPSRPSVSIAPLDLERHAAAVKTLLKEAGGPTAGQPNPLRPFGNTLAAVAITHDKQKEAAFNGALARNKTRYRGHLASGGSHPFSPKYEHSKKAKEPTNEEEKQVLRRVTCGTTYSLLDPSLLEEDPPLRLQRVFHGVTSWDAVVGILGGDFASLQQVDGGWYGAGFYFTPDLDYALKYSREFWKLGSTTGSLPAELQHLGLDSSKEYRVVLACSVQYGNPYPVLNETDFKTKPLVSGHDAHVAVVDFTSGGVFAAKPFSSHKEWDQAYKRPVAEVVVNDPSCVLVRAVLVFDA